MVQPSELPATVSLEGDWHGLPCIHCAWWLPVEVAWRRHTDWIDSRCKVEVCQDAALSWSEARHLGVSDIEQEHASCPKGVTVYHQSVWPGGAWSVAGYHCFLHPRRLWSSSGHGAAGPGACLHLMPCKVYSTPSDKALPQCGMTPTLALY